MVEQPERSRELRCGLFHLSTETMATVTFIHNLVCDDAHIEQESKRLMFRERMPMDFLTKTEKVTADSL